MAQTQDELLRDLIARLRAGEIREYLDNDDEELPAPEEAWEPPVARSERPARRGRKPSAMVTQAQLDRARPGFERIAAVALIGLSTLGTVAAIDGGWDKLATFAPSITALFGGITLQALCTAIQWFYRKQRQSFPYALALAFSAGPTAYGYWPIISAPLMHLLGVAGLTGQAAETMVLITVVAGAVLVDYLPEARLIDG